MKDPGETGITALSRPNAVKSVEPSSMIFRSPAADDGRAVHDLIAACPPLDGNSLYCNLLQCSHFADTCILAEQDGRLKGWISGYRPPQDPDAMFVWQVAVHESARGEGLGTKMLDALFRFPAVAAATCLITTVSPSNRASHALFARFAREHGGDVTVRPCFDRLRHFAGNHEDEELVSVGPLQPRQVSV